MPRCRSASDKFRLYIALISLFSFTHLLPAQERCGTKMADPQAFEQWISSKMEAKKKLGTFDLLGVTYEIPIVVHIIEPASGVSLDISDERVVRQIEILNEDYRRKNPDSINTPPIFLPVAADTEIQFVLAKRDPSGNPTNGIVRAVGERDSYNPLSLTHKSSLRLTSYWPPEHYLNIFVTNLSGFLGFSSFPDTDLPGIDNEIDDFVFDAVLVDADHFGENPSAPFFESFGRTTTHEIGHYLGLRHPWGDIRGCAFDDFVDDTPPADWDNDGLGPPCTFPNPDDDLVCDTDEMFQNYMDYSNDVCMNLFTEGQKVRMRTVMDNSPRRNSLISSPALSAPARFENDLAIRQILTPQEAECTDFIIPSVEVINYGTNEVVSYDISLAVDGMTVQTINQITSIDTFDVEVINFTPELIDTTPSSVSFILTNVNATTDGNTSNNTQSVTITSNSSVSIPFIEDFESVVPKISGSIGPSDPWEVTIAPNETTSNQALQFKAFQNNSAFGNETIIRTPVLNFSGLSSADLIYNYAYAEILDGFLDGLAIRISTDCGETFPNTIFNNHGSDLSTANPTSSSFTPSGPMEWLTDTINITSLVQNTDGVQIAFIGQNGGGNNIFLDDIMVVQVNRNPNDASLLSVNAPLATCNEMTNVSFELLNVGFEDITSLSYSYSIDGNETTVDEAGLSLTSGESETFLFDVELENGDNNISVSVLDVNGVTDEGSENNTIDYMIDRSSTKDSYPLIVDFERPNLWTANPLDDVSIWSKTMTGSNQVLLANGFSQTQLGAQDWFISPELLVGDLDTAGLSFKVSYAAREGFTDRLQVLMSVDCGESYPSIFELLNAFSDSLAVTESSSSWIPSSEADWKEFQIDLKPSIIWQDEIKLAFVFTNGNGNNLYLDDINIGFLPETSSEKSTFTIFPNPAHNRFNISFDLEERDDVEIRIVDLSGRVIFQERFNNVFDQVYDFDVPSQNGFYFVKIIGSQINQTERLYIRR